MPLPRRLLMLLLVLILVLPAASVGAQGAGPQVSQWRTGQPALNETFDRKNSKWDLASDDDVIRELSDGALYMGVKTEDFLAWTGYDEEYADFYLEVDTLHLAGPVNNIIGVVFRQQDEDNFYMAMISSDGYFALGKWLPAGVEWLQEWEQSNAVARGEGVENRIGVLAVGSDIVMVVNDDEVARVKDRSHARGTIGLLAGTNKEEGNLEVAFDNLQLWDKPASTGRRGLGQRNNPQATATPGRRTLGPGNNSQPAATPAPPAPTGDAVVTSDTLNVRAGPGTSYRVVGQLKQGNTVQITGKIKDNSWVKIAVPGQAQAWVATQFLQINIDMTGVPLAQAPAAPPPPKQTARKDVAYLVIENHIGRHITVQVNDKNFRVEGKVGDAPGRYQFVLQGVGWYTVAAQLPNGGSHNWDLFVEPSADKCAGRQGCVALGNTFLMTYY